MYWRLAFSVDYLRENLILDPRDIITGIYTAPAYHLIIEALLVVWILKLLFFTKSFTPTSTLTEKEKNALIEEWEPEPLVPADYNEVDRPHGFKYKITGVPGKVLPLNGENYMNLSSLNFMGMLGNREVEKAAIQTLQKYGVGSCGPRGFYGTVDVHLQLEEKLTNFMCCEEAILYSYGFSTVASAIPAYSKRGDVIFADEGVCFPIQKGIEASRSTVRYFKHNDMDDLERLLLEQEAADKKNPRKAKVTRRFLVVEGIYMNFGDVCHLPKLIEFKYRYKVRIFIEESISFGVLGDNGRGVTEHHGCDIDDVDMICANLENSIGSVGGFCCGKSYVIDHQRLSGLGYCFSASLPPMLASGSITALNLMQHETVKFSELKSKCKYTNNLLQSVHGLSAISDDCSPVQHILLSNPSGDRSADEASLEEIVEKCMEKGLALTQSRYLLKQEIFSPPPSIRLSINVELSKNELKDAVSKLNQVCHEVL